MRQTLIALYSLCLVSVLPVGLRAQQAATEGLQEAIARAPAEKRLILVEFFSYNSVESKMLHDLVLGRPEVKELLDDKFIVVRAEVERDLALATRFGVTHAPAVVLLAADGHEVDRVAGVPRSADFRKTLEAAVAGKSELAVLRERSQAAGLNVEQRTALAATYAKRGAVADAVAEYGRALDLSLQSKEEGRFRGVIVRRLAALTEQFPEAGGPVKALRDRLEQTAVAGHDEVLPALVGLNSALKAPERNADLYLKLPGDSPLRRQILPSVLGPLVQTKHYAEAAGVVDLESFINGVYALAEESAPKPPTPSPQPGFKQQVPQHEGEGAAPESRIASLTVTCVEALVGAGQPRKAQRVAGRALDYLHEEDIRGRLTEAAKRAGGKDATIFIAWLEREYPVAKAAAVAGK